MAKLHPQAPPPQAVAPLPQGFRPRLKMLPLVGHSVGRPTVRWSVAPGGAKRVRLAGRRADMAQDGGRLTTHVLDTMHGRPGAGLEIELFRLEGERRQRLKAVRTNDDGRCDAPLLDGRELSPGVYELVFHVAPYFRAQGVRLPEPAFLDAVPIRFGVAEPDRHYHVPLLIAPWAYSTYRGS
jgi:5-hydroxyisourate hydrolase